MPSPYGTSRTGDARLPVDVRLPGDGPAHANGPARERDGSIIIIVATDAPLLPTQCRRLAQRAGLGLGRAGGLGATTSGDLFLAFSNGNRALPPPETPATAHGVATIRMLVDTALDPLFEATVEATEEAIVNALVAAETMTGRDDLTAHRLPHDRLVEVMGRYGRLRA